MSVTFAWNDEKFLSMQMPMKETDMCDPTSIANLDLERGLRESSLKARMRLVQSAWDDAEREIRASMLELNARVDRLPGIADLVKAVVIMHVATWAVIGVVVVALAVFGIIGH